MSTHFNFEQIIHDVDPRVRLNPASVGRTDGPPYVYVVLGPIELTLVDPAAADKMAGAFTEAARLLREAQDGAS